MRRFESSRAEHFVASEDLGIGDDHRPGLLAQKAPGQSADLDLGESPSRRALGRGALRPVMKGLERGQLAQAVFLPNLGQALSLTLIVAKHPHPITVPGPPVELGEKLLALGFGHERLRRASGDGAEPFQAGEPQSQRLVLQSRPSFATSLLNRFPTRRTRHRRRLIGGPGESFCFRHFDQSHPPRSQLLQKILPAQAERIILCQQLRIVPGLLGDRGRFTEQKQAFWRQVIEQGSQPSSPGAPLLSERDEFLEQPNFATRRDGHLRDRLFGNLGDGIERAERFQFVAEKLQADRPRRREGKNIQNAAAQRDVSFLADPRFRLVALLLQPFHEIQWIDLKAGAKAARHLSQPLGAEAALEQGHDTGHDEGRACP